MNRTTWLSAILALPLVRLLKQHHPSYKKGEDVPSWILTSHNGPCAKFGCDVNVVRTEGCKDTIRAVPGTGDALFQVFGGEHRVVPLTIQWDSLVDQSVVSPLLPGVPL